MEQSAQTDSTGEYDAERIGPAKLLRAALSEEHAPGSLWTPWSPDELDQMILEFDILCLVGFGGMGAVYQAYQKELDRVVAIKVMAPKLRGDPAFAERFRTEARTLAKLNHPNIVHVYGFGESSSGDSYFVMEYVDACNLRKLIENGDLSNSEILEIVGRVCDALEYAHDEGLIHRDIKPSNIFFSRRGEVKVGDFGLVKLMGDHNTSNDDFELTASGTAIGTPSYMAPEQRQGENVDVRADIYSLAVMLFEMLTGEILPPGSSKLPESTKIQTKLAKTILKAVRDSPDQRHKDITGFQTEVNASLASDTEGRTQRTKLPWVISLVALLITAIALLLAIEGRKWMANDERQLRSVSPEQGGRLVYIPINESASRHVSWLEGIEEMDSTDLVRISASHPSWLYRQNYGSVFAISKRGTVTPLSPSERKVRFPPQTIAVSAPGHDSEILALTSSGGVHSLGIDTYPKLHESIRKR